MKQLFCIFLLIANCSYGQNTFKAVILDNSSKEKLIGASGVLKGTSNGACSGSDGSIEIRDIPDGTQIIPLLRNNFNSIRKEIIPKMSE